MMIMKEEAPKARTDDRAKDDRPRSSVMAFWTALLIAAAPPGPKLYQSTEMRDLEAILPVLKKHVAYVRVEARAKDSGPLEAEERDGFGVVLDRNKIALLCFITTDAHQITVEGANGKRSEAKVVLYDAERRVAILESKLPLKTLGLEPAPIAPKDARKLDGEVFALTTTGVEAAVLHGVFTYVGDEEEYGGHSRVDLLLERGMPVFDHAARFVGFSRNVAWDKDRQMLVTPEMIRDARTSTGAATTKSPANEQPAKKPWWSK